MIRFKKYERPQFIDQSLPSCQIQPADAGDPGAFKNPPQATTASPFLPPTPSGKQSPTLGGKDIQHSAANNSGLLQIPHNLMEGYGRALYEKTTDNEGELFVRSSFRQRSSIPWCATWLRGLCARWLRRRGVAGITVWDPKGTPVLMPTVDGGVTAPGAAIRWSLANSGYLKSSKNYNRGVYVNGSFINSNPTGIFNPQSFVRTPDYSLSNASFVFPNVRNPGDFNTDATLLKKFPSAIMPRAISRHALRQRMSLTTPLTGYQASPSLLTRILTLPPSAALMARAAVA
jgi:hypothetical protein